MYTKQLGSAHHESSQLGRWGELTQKDTRIQKRAPPFIKLSAHYHAMHINSKPITEGTWCPILKIPRFTLWSLNKHHNLASSHSTSKGPPTISSTIYYSSPHPKEHDPTMQNKNQQSLTNCSLPRNWISRGFWNIHSFLSRFTNKFIGCNFLQTRSHHIHAKLYPLQLVQVT
jgi:hypothetical protein